MSLLYRLFWVKKMKIFGSKWEKHEAGWQGVGEEVLEWIAKYAKEKLAAASVQEKGGEEKRVGTDGEKEGEKEEVGGKGGGDNSVERN